MHTLILFVVILSTYTSASSLSLSSGEKNHIYTPAISEIELEVTSKQNISVYVSPTLDYINDDINTGRCVNTDYCFIKNILPYQSYIITIVNSNSYDVKVYYNLYYHTNDWKESPQIALLFLFSTFLLFLFCMILVVKCHLSELQQSHIRESIV